MYTLRLVINNDHSNALSYFVSFCSKLYIQLKLKVIGNEVKDFSSDSPEFYEIIKGI